MQAEGSAAAYLVPSPYRLRELKDKGVDVLLDDRDERPSVKLKDADLIGILLRVAIGKRGLEEGKAEVKLRTDKDVSMVPMTDVVDSIVAKVVELGGKLA